MARKLGKSLPEPRNISDARTGLRRPEFNQYLKNNFPEIDDRDGFIEFLDHYLQAFGQGAAFVNDHYSSKNQQANPNLFIGVTPTFGAISSAPCKYGEPAMDMSMGEYLNSFCLTAYHAPDHIYGIVMPIDRLCELWKQKEIENFTREGIVIGAHETLHLRDRMYDLLHATRQKQGADIEDKSKTPNEIRAQRMEALALRYFGYEPARTLS